jgi:O-antigen/teichoic acid export membrane protein
MIDLGSLWQRARGSAVFMGMAGTAVRHGGNLILLPLAMKILSPAEMALWVVFVAIGAFGNLADFGFGQAITRVYSYFWAGAKDYDREGLKTVADGLEPNWTGLEDLTRAVGGLYRWLSLFAGMLLLGVGTWFVAPSKPSHNISPLVSTPASRVASLPPSTPQESSAPNSPQVNSSARDIFEHEWKLWALWGASVASVLYSLGTSYWTLACQGINQVREVQRVNLWAGVAYSGSACLMLLAGWGLVSMVCATFIRALITAQMCRASYRRAAPENPNHAGRLHLEFLRRLWPSAWKFGVIALSVYLVSPGTVLICRWYLSDEATAAYGVTAQVAGVLLNVSSLWLQVKVPEITILRTQGLLRKMSLLFAKRLGWTMFTYLFLATLFVLFGNRALEWKGTESKFLPTPLLIVYLAYTGQQLFTTQFVWLTYTENVVPYYVIAFCTGVGLILISIPLTKHYGIWGLVAAPILAAIPATSWYPVLRGFRGQALSIREFFRAALLPSSLAGRGAQTGKSL